jgi:hypothetical protein
MSNGRASHGRGAAPLRARRAGQSAVIVALCLPFLVAFTLLVVEVAGRWLEVAQMEDALQQATRSAVQTLDYSALARGEHGLRAAECRSVTTEDPGGCAELLAVAQRYLLANLGGVRGLVEAPEDVAARVQWTVLPRGGACAVGRRTVAEPTPLLCAEVRPLMRGLVGWAPYAPLIAAADTIDPIR